MKHVVKAEFDKERGFMTTEPRLNENRMVLYIYDDANHTVKRKKFAIKDE